MVKQQLWILNSSLLVIFFSFLLINFYLEQEPPLLKVVVVPKDFGTKKLPITKNLEKICKQDIFDTFSQDIQSPSQQNLVTPIPELKLPEPAPVPEEKKPEFVPNLTITLKGIIFANEESKSIVMFADETNKEAIYHLGDKIKDGQIIKIGKNKVVILRANGQQETYILRQTDKLLQKEDEDKWKYIVKKVDDNNFVVDPIEFCKEIDSVGLVVEQLSLLTAYDKGEVIGLRIGKPEQKGIASLLGLNQNDLILSVNGIGTIEVKDRIKIYDNVTSLKLNDKVIVKIKRDNQDISIEYKLEKIDRPKKSILSSGKAEEQKDGFKMNKDQEREANIRNFEKYHKNPRHKEVVNDIRQKFLENLRARTRRNVRGI